MTRPRVLAVIPDLMFQSRVREQAEALDYDLTVADSMDDATRGLEALPPLLVIDLHAAGIDTSQVIRDAKGQGTRVLAFGRHTEAAVLREARDAGADAVVVRSTFVEEMPQLLREHAGA